VALRAGRLYPHRPVPFGAETVVGLVDMVGLLPYPVGNCQTTNISTKRHACHVWSKKICMTNIRKERGQTHYSHQTHHEGVRLDLFGYKVVRENDAWWRLRVIVDSH
jgi:hypothetical protein